MGEMTGHTREQDRAMMLDTAQWPVWPLLPLKRPASKPREWIDTAVLLAVPIVNEHVTIVRGANPFDDDRAAWSPETLHVDAVLDEGWEVD